MLQDVARCCKMLDGVGSSLKMVKFLLQHFWMLQDVARVFPAPSQHVPTMLQDVVLKCCVCLAGPFSSLLSGNKRSYGKRLLVN